MKFARLSNTAHWIIHNWQKITNRGLVHQPVHSFTSPRSRARPRAGFAPDRALTAARKAILATSSSAQWWIPALFMRTPEGRIWQEPEQTAAAAQTIIRFTGDRNVIITGKVGGQVNIHQ